MLKKLFNRPKKGYVMILLAVAIPVFLMAVNLGIKRIQKSHRQEIKTSATFATGQAALAKYNPAKRWDAQDKRVYSAAAQALNDRAFDLNKSMTLTPGSVPVYYSAKSALTGYSLTKAYYYLSSFGLKNSYIGTNYTNDLLTNQATYKTLLCDENPTGAVVFNSSNSQLSFNLYTTTSTSNTAAYNVVYYNSAATANTNKLTVSLDTTNNCITCNCLCLGKTVKAYPAKCDVDIVLTLPTNHAACTSGNDSGTLIAPNATGTTGIDSTPIVQISKAYQKFLKENFTHTRGVAVGVVPYSAKISVPPDRTGWTVAIPPMSAFPDKPYIKQAVAYGTDGQTGGDIVGTAIQYDWGNIDGADSDTTANLNVGFPIMFRQGYRATVSTDSCAYRGVAISLGMNNISISPAITLLSTDSPSTGTNNDYKFQRMNPNPCYLGHCNLLAGVCEKTCPTYMANPYFITELTDDVQNVIYDLSLIRPINDPKNKSNFLFLAVQWAQNLLSTWTAFPSTTADPNQKFAHTARASKKKAVILIVNAPDKFEPQELTYLGFNNDNSEIPMHESDTISFVNGGYQTVTVSGTTRYQGTKGIIQYSTTGNTTPGNEGFKYTSNETATVTALKPGTIKIIMDLNDGTPSIEFFKDNGITQNVGDRPENNSYKHNVPSNATFVFDGPTQVFNWSDGKIDFGSGSYTTKGPNFGHNLSIYKLKYKLTNATIASATLSNQVLRFYGKYVQSDNDINKELIENKISHATNMVTDATKEQRSDPCIYMNKDKYQSSGTSITDWQWEASGTDYWINAYDFCPACYNIGGGKFIMAANDFPDAKIVFDSELLATNSSSTTKGNGVYAAAYPGKYRVFDLSGFTYPTGSNNVSVSTGTVQYKSKVEYLGSYISKRNYTRSNEVIVKASAGPLDDTGETSWTTVSGDNEQIKLETKYKCDEGNNVDICGCDGNSLCTGRYSVISGGWTSGTTKAANATATGDYFFDWHTKNCANGLASGYNGCTYGRRFTRTGTCDKSYSETGAETSSCGSNDTLTETTLTTTYVSYTETYATDGAKTSSYKTGSTASNLSTSSSTNIVPTNSYITWNNGTPSITNSNHRYKLHNFFFVNKNNVTYSSTADKTSILANQNIGTITESGNTWLCFCGDGQLTLKLNSGSKSVKFSDISASSDSSSGSADSASVVENDKSYTISGRKEFFLNTSQLKKNDDGNYSFKLAVPSGVKIISVDLLNYPYTVVKPEVKMYSGNSVSDTEATTCDFATSDAGSTTGNVTFSVTKKAAFTVQAKVPYAWIKQTDFRQTSGTANIYCNDNSHTFTVKITAPSSSTTINSVSPLNTLGKTANNTSVTVSAERKLSSFTLGGKYDYVSKETWTKYYPSQTNYHRSSDLKIEGTASASGATTGVWSNWIYGDNNQVKARIKYVCSRVGTCAEVCDNNSYSADKESSINSDSGWEFKDMGGAWLTKGCTCNGCNNDNAAAYTYGIAGAVTFARSPSCSKTYNYLGEQQSTTCGKSDTLIELNKISSTHDCTKTYQNTRTTSSTCASSYGGSYIRDASKDVKCADDSGCANKAWSTSPANLTASNWSGSFGKYTYVVTNVNANVTGNVTNEGLKVTSPTQLYSNGSFGTTTAALGGNNTTSPLTATTAEGSTHYSYSATATNCELELASRTTASGTVGSTTLVAIQSKDTQSVTIDPGRYEFNLVGDGNYTVTIPCKNVVVSGPAMVDTTKFIRYNHPNISTEGLKNVRIVDFNKSENNKPTKYGNVIFGTNSSGNLNSTHKYTTYDHLKYWSTTGNGNNLYRTDSVDGDYFIQFMDFDGNCPGIRWYFPSSASIVNANVNANTTGYGEGRYGDYRPVKYAFSGLHRAFFPWGEQEYHSTEGARVDLISGNKMAFFLGGFTLPLNYALCNNGYQTSAGSTEIAPASITSPSTAVASVTSGACEKLKGFEATNTRVYVIKYKVTDANLGTASKAAIEKCTDSSRIYSASSETELNTALDAIAADIKSFASYEDSRVVETP